MHWHSSNQNSKTENNKTSKYPVTMSHISQSIKGHEMFKQPIITASGLMKDAHLMLSQTHTLHNNSSAGKVCCLLITGLNPGSWCPHVCSSWWAGQLQHCIVWTTTDSQCLCQTMGPHGESFGFTLSLNEGNKKKYTKVNMQRQPLWNSSVLL